MKKQFIVFLIVAALLVTAVDADAKMSKKLKKKSQVALSLETTATESITSTGTTFFSCSGPADDTNWFYYPAFSTINCPGTGYTYLGPYGAGGTATSPPLSVGTHKGIVINVQVAFIDSWDGEAFKITADGVLVYSETHLVWTQSFTNTCQSGWNDYYENVTFGFNHIASTLQLVISSGLDEGSSNEAWGVCNLNVKPTSYQVNPDGSPAVTEYVTAAGTTWFACSGPAKDGNWKYSPSFSTINCPGTGYTYLGPYGAGGTATSPILTVSGTHTGILMTFALAFIDSWDGEAFKITADGNLVYSQTHLVWTQSFTNTCQSGWNDFYENVTFGFNHTASTVTFVISSALDEASSNEAWGVCDFNLKFTQYQYRADGSPIIQQYITSAGTSYFACSGPADDTNWVYSPAFSTINCPGTGYTYLGPYGAGGTATSPTFTVSGTHQGIVINVQVAFIDSWDGEAFKITADGNLVYSETHQYLTQSTSNTCQSVWNDYYQNVTLGFNHIASTLTLVISSGLDEGSSNEAWGICNLNIKSTPYQVNPDGSPVVPEYVTAAGTTWFACSGPANDANWRYSPSFSTINCPGTGYTYLGPYGAGGTATSPTLTVSGTHTGILMTFALAFIDSWDGEAFKITADGILVYSQTHLVWTQSFTNTCQSGWNDFYENVTFGFNHTASTVTFVISSALDEASSNEAWGVCNFNLKSTQYQYRADGSPIIPQYITPAGASYFACSGPADDTNWVYSPAFSTINCPGTGYTYLGPYGAGGTATSPTFTVSGTHQGIVINFQLAFIDSWDGEAFKITADGNLVYSQTHLVWTQSFTNTCQSGWNDFYESVTFGFNHTASTLTLVISSGLDEGSSNEAWGVCNFNIKSTSYQVNPDGSPIAVVLSYFPCSGPTKDSSWTYSPPFSTITCPGTGYTYLGPYGGGGKATSSPIQLQPHQGLSVSLQLAFIDSWDGEAFKISADGVLVYSETHNYHKQSSSDSCGNPLYADAYESVAFGFNHTASTLTLLVNSGLDEGASNEAWGICNLNLKVSSCPVLADGTISC